jgi:hypothetical protein
MSSQEKPRETGKSFSISSILENNEESSKKDNTNVPAIISKLEFPENSSKNILTNPQHCFLNPLSTWYQWVIVVFILLLKISSFYFIHLFVFNNDANKLTLNINECLPQNK